MTVDTSRITITDQGFHLINVRRPDGDHGATYPFEYTASPYLALVARGRDGQGRAAFGDWSLTHIPTGYSLWTSETFGWDADRMRWLATELSKLDGIDWDAPRKELAAALEPAMRSLIRQALEEDRRG
jgi:hypothetical protein